MTDSSILLLERAIAASGLSTRQYAQQLLTRDERTIRRWLTGETQIPRTVVEWLTAQPVKIITRRRPRGIAP